VQEIRGEGGGYRFVLTVEQNVDMEGLKRSGSGRFETEWEGGGVKVVTDCFILRKLDSDLYFCI